MRINFYNHILISRNKMFYEILMLVLFQNVHCWPDLRLYTRQHPTTPFVVTASNFAGFILIKNKYII